MLLVGFILSFNSIEVGDNVFDPISCGTVWEATREGEDADYGRDLQSALAGFDFEDQDYEGQCADAVSTQRAITIPLMSVGALLLVGGAVIRTGRPTT